MVWLRRGDPGPKPILDMEYLGRLESHVGQAMLQELLSDGLLELTDRLEHLNTLAVTGDAEGVARLGHDIIATAGHLGLSALSVAAVDMNRQARDPKARDVTALVAPVTALAEPSITALRGHLGLPNGP